METFLFFPPKDYLTETVLFLKQGGRAEEVGREKTSSRHPAECGD